jgi:hypothetical protein
MEFHSLAVYVAAKQATRLNPLSKLALASLERSLAAAARCECGADEAYHIRKAMRLTAHIRVCP